MSLWIVMVLLPLTAWVGFETGRRYQKGLKEKFLDSLEEERERRGRRGTVKMKTLKIRR
jgi:hypothetical protein